MNKTRENLLDEIAELEDEIACAEHDEEQDGDTSYDLDNARCRLSDLKESLREMGGKQ